MKHLGIEIELTGVLREDVAKALGYLFKSEVISVEQTKLDLPYISYRITDKYGGIWRVLRDRSITPQAYNSDREIVDLLGTERCVEVVTPVLDAKTIRLLFSVIDVLNALGGVVNRTCGVHVHIDAMNPAECVNLFNRYVSCQSDLIERFNVYENRLGKYCRLYDKDLVMPDFEFYDEILSWIRLNCLEDDEELRSVRYYSLNLYSIKEHNTIEYRLFNGSLDKAEIARYIKFVLDFSYMGLESEYSSTIEYILLGELERKE